MLCFRERQCMEELLNVLDDSSQEDKELIPDEDGIIWIDPDDIPNLRERFKSIFAGGENLRPEMR